MKCRLCDHKAAINMPQHHLALCKTHFLAWFPEQTERFIRKYQMATRQERILVAVSGGKDSLGLWDVLWKLGYPAEGLYIDLGVGDETGYSAQSRRLAEQFALARGLRLHVFDVRASYGETIPEQARRTRRGSAKPCAVCGVSKRHIFNQAALEMGFPVLATGHNLDDEAAVLFGNVLSWSGEQILRQAPVLPARDGLPCKVKPFCRFYERETAAYALLAGIDYVEEECPFAVGNHTNAHKALLNQLEASQPGAKLRFYLSFLEARKDGWLSGPFPAPVPLELHPCPTCGQPTSNPGECAFCRQVKIPD